MPLHNISFEIKLKAVETYISSGQSLRTVAKESGIPYRTLAFWVKQYKDQGVDGLRIRKSYKKRLPEDIEHAIMSVKENNPSLSINSARIVLKEQGITISPKGIWRIWKRYGLAKRRLHNPLSPFAPASAETSYGLARAKHFIEEGNVKAAAQILNALPCIPADPVVKTIPDALLSPRRQLDRLNLEFGEISFPEYAKKARTIAYRLEKEGSIYSSIIANFCELNALGWTGKPEEKNAILNRLAEKMKNLKSSALWFLFYIEQARMYCNSLQITEALEVSKKCRRLVYLLPTSFYREEFGTLLTILGKYKEAHAFYTTALKHENRQTEAARITLKKAIFGHGMAGEYLDAKKVLAQAQLAKNAAVFSAPWYNLGKALIAFGRGNLAQATKNFLESLERASKEELYNIIYATSTGLATVAMALNKKAEARHYLRKYLPLMRKYGLLKEALIVTQLLGAQEPIPEDAQQMPTLYLLNLLIRAQRTLKFGDYRKAYAFAQRQKLLGLFHRWIVFFPEPVLKLLEKGKDTGLPKAILRFPVFNQSIPVYHVKFLGNMIVSKDQHYLRVKSSPKEKALLIHLALRTGTPGTYLMLDDLYENFWKDSSRPSNLLLHLLARLKKKLRMPSHLLSISSQYGEPRLLNRGIYLTTDYNEFTTLLTQIKSLERVDEWHFAKRDYVRAFTLMRGAPFMKIYDQWSERMREVILTTLEDEVVSFARGCLAHNNRKDAKKILSKINAIIPDSNEIKVLLEKL